MSSLTTNVEESSQPPAPRHLPQRFLAAILLQSAIIFAVPFQSFITYQRGQTVTLQTAPVDPYDFIRGYSQTLGYDISLPDTLSALPGGSQALRRGNKTDETDRWIYVTLQAPENAQNPTTPIAWEPVAVSTELPQSLASNQVALKGRYEEWRVEYGLETYYMPESQRDDINAQIVTIQQSGEQTFVVDVKVDDKGNSVPVSLWVGAQQYRF